MKRLNFLVRKKLRHVYEKTFLIIKITPLINHMNLLISNREGQIKIINNLLCTSIMLLLDY